MNTFKSAQSVATGSPSAAAYHASLADYVAAGTRRGQSLGNRGPVRYDSSQQLHPDILEAYWQHGFYIFTDVISSAEIEALRRDVNFLLERAPTGQQADTDARGRPAYGGEFTRPTYTFARPLSDPWGGTTLLNGRHPVKMTEPQAAANAPDETVYLISGMCQSMPAGLRLYGHADLLSIAAAINGDDFVPYNDAIFVKQAGLGGAVAWHQDGVTHWQAKDWDEGIHGFNFQVQLYTCTPYNCLWVMPGTHKLGKIDIKQLLADNNGSEQLPGAVPLTCAPGDVTVVNRQLLHGSFANSSDDTRISLTFGFHRRASVLGASGALSQSNKEVYDAQRIFDRACVIGVAIDARAQYYPDQRRYNYLPLADVADSLRFSPETWERVIRDYNLKDLSI
ncbi:MAG: phytanoyl-CoA dioxygenase family protein [bacterium]